MDLDRYFAKTPATLDEIKRRVAVCARPASALPQRRIRHRQHAPDRNRGNWTISLRSVAPDALWEASEIVADIQEAYELAAAA